MIEKDCQPCKLSNTYKYMHRILSLYNRGKIVMACIVVYFYGTKFYYK